MIKFKDINWELLSLMISRFSGERNKNQSRKFEAMIHHHLELPLCRYERPILHFIVANRHFLIFSSLYLFIAVIGINEILVLVKYKADTCWAVSVRLLECWDQYHKFFLLQLVAPIFLEFLDKMLNSTLVYICKIRTHYVPKSSLLGLTQFGCHH